MEKENFPLIGLENILIKKDSKFKVKISKILVEIILYCLSEGVHPFYIANRRDLCLRG